MANKVQILDKIKRNLDMLGISATRGASSVTVSGLTISYVDASIQSPMGGVSDAAAPFLGIGVANPGKLKIKGAAGENTVAAMMDSATNLKVLRLCCSFANNVVLEAGDTATELADLPGSPDLHGMGQ
jgi:hypothetical protein